MFSWFKSSSAKHEVDVQGPRLSDEDMIYYTENYCFSAREVGKLFKKFKAMCQEGRTTVTRADLSSIEEMDANPFATRILEIFSEDGSGCLDFEKFLNMAGVFSENSADEVKLIWAFALWDFDGDDVIGDEDIKEGLSIITETVESTSLTPVTLSLEEVDEIVSRVQQEIDPDNYGLSYSDFRKVLLRMPDFISNFHMNFIA